MATFGLVTLEGKSQRCARNHGLLWPVNLVSILTATAQTLGAFNLPESRVLVPGICSSGYTAVQVNIAHLACSRASRFTRAVLTTAPKAAWSRR